MLHGIKAKFPLMYLIFYSLFVYPLLACFLFEMVKLTKGLLSERIKGFKKL